MDHGATVPYIQKLSIYCAHEFAQGLDLLLIEEYTFENLSTNTFQKHFTSDVITLLAP